MSFELATEEQVQEYHDWARTYWMESLDSYENNGFKSSMTKLVIVGGCTHFFFLRNLTRASHLLKKKR